MDCTIKKRLSTFGFASALAFSACLSLSPAYAQDAGNDAGFDPFGVSNVQDQAPIPPSFAPGAPNALPIGPGGFGTANLSPEEAAELEKRLAEEAEEQKQKLREEAFDGAIDQILPLKPEEIREMFEYFREAREAAETPIVVPEPLVQVQTIALDPGAIPKTIVTAPGHVTTLSILDVSGQPWPIRDLSWAGDFEVTPPDEGGHLIRITPLTAHGVGNLSITLVDLITPITFSLKSNLEETYYRFDARIPKLGPLASAPLIRRGGLAATAGEDENLIAVLEGAPASEAEKLEVGGVDARTSAWQIEEEYFLRTPHTLLSPAWKASVKSGDGMNVYTLDKVSVVLLSDQGRIVQARMSPVEE